MSATEAAAPAAPAAPPPAAPAMPLPQAMVSIGGAMVLALTQGLGQGFVSANTQQFAGALGISATDASWLLVAYLIPRASLPIMLIKIRTQYGLRRFAEIGILCYVVVAFASLWISDLRSAVVIQFLSGVTSAPLSSLAFLYFLQPLSAAWKMRLGLPMALFFLMTGPSLARVLSPALIGDGNILAVHLVVLGMAMASLAFVYRVPLTPVPHQKVILPMDLCSFVLIAFGFASIVTASIIGPIHWWADVPWLGWLLAAGLASLTLAAVIETHRKAPLIDIRWLLTPAMVNLTGALLLFRLILSEQSTGAPRMFQVLGVAPAQLTGLFAIICLASAVGALACLAWLKPGRVERFHLVALALIALGAWMDSHATIDTRPAQMIVSQAIIGFAGMLFLPPAMMVGLGAALARGPGYLLSFIVVFLSTQSIGGVMGGAIFTTLVNRRQALHLQTLAEQLTPTSPTVAAEIARRMAGLASRIPDGAARRVQAVSQIATDASNQAYVMAYNDLYYMTFLIAVGAGAILLLRMAFDRMTAAAAPAATPSTAGPQA